MDVEGSAAGCHSMAYDVHACSAEGHTEGGCAPDEGQRMNRQAATLCCPDAAQT